MRLFDGTGGGKWVSEYSAGRVRNLTEGGESPAIAQKRVFGVGYVEAESQVGSLRTTRRVFAPFGDVLCFVVVYTLEKLGSASLGPEGSAGRVSPTRPHRTSLTVYPAPRVRPYGWPTHTGT